MSQVSGIDILLCFICISKFGSFKIPLAWITSLNFILEPEDLFCWCKRKRCLWVMATAQAVENHGDESGITRYLQRRIYQSIPTWTHPQNSVPAAEAPSLKIPSLGKCLRWWRRPCQSAWEQSKGVKWKGQSYIIILLYLISTGGCYIPLMRQNKLL